MVDRIHLAYHDVIKQYRTYGVCICPVHCIHANFFLIYTGVQPIGMYGVHMARCTSNQYLSVSTILEKPFSICTMLYAGSESLKKREVKPDSGLILNWNLGSGQHNQHNYPVYSICIINQITKLYTLLHYLGLISDRQILTLRLESTRQFTITTTIFDTC